MKFLDTLHTWLSGFWEAIYTGFSWIMDGLLLALEFVFFSIVDGFFTVVETFFATLDLSAVAFNYAAQWSSLPDQVVWLISGVGLPQCLTMLGGAYALRLVLNLIPSVLTRV
ncbi:DUF2523 family protein [Desulfogranum marinum]|uniref:DUF2523 family protein n=1 Tax=Desulfogranum marinum TaxID=453220 RepID=UPI0029C7C646|nr:DUF2523 family protein [Desulfogranum marinum]